LRDGRRARDNRGMLDAILFALFSTGILAVLLGLVAL
jgi:hypothetical protein